MVKRPSFETYFATDEVEVEGVEDSESPGEGKGLPVQHNGKKQKNSCYKTRTGGKRPREVLDHKLPCCEAGTANDGRHEERAVHSPTNSLLHHGADAIVSVYEPWESSPSVKEELINAG